MDVPLLRSLRDLAIKNGVRGYTVLPTLAGGGDQGRWRDDQVTGGAGSKVVFATIVKEDTADRFLTALEPLLDEYSLIVTITTVEVIRGDNF